MVGEVYQHFQRYQKGLPYNRTGGSLVHNIGNRIERYLAIAQFVEVHQCIQDNAVVVLQDIRLVFLIVVCYLRNIRSASK